MVQKIPPTEIVMSKLWRSFITNVQLLSIISNFILNFLLSPVQNSFKTLEIRVSAFSKHTLVFMFHFLVCLAVSHTGSNLHPKKLHEAFFCHQFQHSIRYFIHLYYFYFTSPGVSLSRASRLRDVPGNSVHGSGTTVNFLGRFRLVQANIHVRVRINRHFRNIQRNTGLFIKSTSRRCNLFCKSFVGSDKYVIVCAIGSRIL